MSRARAAGRRAGSVHLVGQTTQEGKRATFDVRAGRDRGAGEVVIDGAAATVRRIGDTVYIRGDDKVNGDFATDPQELARLRGRWLTGPVDSVELQETAGFVSLDAVLDQLLLPEGSLSKGRVRTEGGQRVVPVVDDTTGSPLLVALDGEPLPVRISAGPRAGVGSTFDFSEWGVPVDVAAPPAVEQVPVRLSD